MLLCSRISSFSLVAGKLVAGVANTLLLIAAAVPLFSLVFFFGGISLQQVLMALLIYIVTTLLVGTAGLFFSTLVRRPAVSTALTYVVVIIWVIMPLLLSFLSFSSGSILNAVQLTLPGNQSPMPMYRPTMLYIWNPATALLSTFQLNNAQLYPLGFWKLVPWAAYTVSSLIVTALLFSFSMLTVKPNPEGRFVFFNRKSTVTRQSLERIDHGNIAQNTAQNGSHLSR
jgi:hypothetical protein